MTPAVLTTEEELKKAFVYDDFCGANFSKYLIKESRKKVRERFLGFLSHAIPIALTSFSLNIVSGGITFML